MSSVSNHNVFILTQDVNLSQIFLSYSAIETVRRASRAKTQIVKIVFFKCLNRHNNCCGKRNQQKPVNKAQYYRSHAFVKTFGPSHRKLHYWQTIKHHNISLILHQNKIQLLNNKSLPFEPRENLSLGVSFSRVTRRSTGMSRPYGTLYS